MKVRRVMIEVETETALPLAALKKLAQQAFNAKQVQVNVIGQVGKKR